MAPLLEYLRQTILSALPALSYFSVPSLPSISLTLTPKFNETQSVTSLIGVLVVDGSPQIKAGKVLLEMNMQWPNVPSNNYSGSHALQVSDENGPLPILFKDKNDTRYWYSETDAEGKLTTVFEAFARKVDGHEPLGPRVDLREDQGGLIGAGVTFIPVPPNRNTIFDIQLRWNLTGAPDGTSAASSLGDELHTRKTGTTDVLSLSNYIVGPVNRYTSKIPRENGLIQDFGMYWFGTPQSFDVQKLARETEELFIGMAPFFEDTEDSYRVFIRFNQRRGFGGTGLYRSFVMEYDPWEEFDDLYLTFLLAHEMVHNWALIEMGDKREDEEGGFYAEGVANYYGAVLPYRFGIVDTSNFLQAVNNELSAYYTNPRIHLSDKEASKIAWTDMEAQRLIYNRGGVYMYATNAEIVHASGGIHSIDESVLKLLRKKNSKEPYGLREWLEIVEEELGPRGYEGYKAMAGGEVVIPSADFLGPEFELVREDQYPYELGFSQFSVSEGKIVGLVPASRATEAGVKEGDELVRFGNFWNAADHYGRNQTLVLKRDGKEFEVSYLPRGWKNVESWQVVEKGKGSEHRELR